MQTKDLAVVPKITDAYPILAKMFNNVQKEFNISKEDADENLTRWIKGLLEQTHINIPAPQVEPVGDFRLIQLLKTDPRGVFSGRYVGCCQHPQGWAAPCVWHGHVSPNGAFWVVEFKSIIVATAWVWRYNDNLVIDSIEKPKKYDDAFIYGLYQMASRRVIGRMGISKVYVGGGYNGKWNTSRSIERPFPSPQGYSYQEKVSNRVVDADDSEYVHLLARA